MLYSGYSCRSTYARPVFGSKERTTAESGFVAREGFTSTSLPSRFTYVFVLDSWSEPSSFLASWAALGTDKPGAVVRLTVVDESQPQSMADASIRAAAAWRPDMVTSNVHAEPR